MKHNYDFLKHNKAVDDNKVALLLEEWQQNLLDGDDLAVRLTDFVVFRYEAIEKEQRPQSYVVRVIGYQTIKITPLISDTLCCCYSPLSNTLIGGISPVDYAVWNTKKLVQKTYSSVNGIKLSPLDPLTDDQTKRLLMAADNDYWFRDLCLSDRATSAKNRYVCLAMQIDDPTLAVVKYIRTVLPDDKRKILMDVYDTYGPIDTVVGDALLHLDKFRSF
jgi:WD40 repeat protein